MKWKSDIQKTYTHTYTDVHKYIQTQTMGRGKQREEKPIELPKC